LEWVKENDDQFNDMEKALSAASDKVQELQEEIETLTSERDDLQLQLNSAAG
jgi:peptidoglycan hydrolase CwlO-like protein